MKIRFYIHGLCGSRRMPLLERHWYWKGWQWGPRPMDPIHCSNCNDLFTEEEIAKLGYF